MDLVPIIETVPKTATEEAPPTEPMRVANNSDPKEKDAAPILTDHPEKKGITLIEGPSKVEKVTKDLGQKAKDVAPILTAHPDRMERARLPTRMGRNHGKREKEEDPILIARQSLKENRLPDHQGLKETAHKEKDARLLIRMAATDHPTGIKIKTNRNKGHRLRPNLQHHYFEPSKWWCFFMFTP